MLLWRSWELSAFHSSQLRFLAISVNIEGRATTANTNYQEMDVARAQVVYQLNRNGELEDPHLIEVQYPSKQDGLRLKGRQFSNCRISIPPLLVSVDFQYICSLHTAVFYFLQDSRSCRATFSCIFFSRPVPHCKQFTSSHERTLAAIGV